MNKNVDGLSFSHLSALDRAADKPTLFVAIRTPVATAPDGQLSQTWYTFPPRDREGIKLAIRDSRRIMQAFAGAELPELSEAEVDAMADDLMRRLQPSS